VNLYVQFYNPQKNQLKKTIKQIMKRHATAVWNGSGKDGKGSLTTQSTTLNNTQYSYNSRFAEGVGTNPEELVAAAHAGCFNMKLSFVLGGAGFTPTSLETTATIELQDSGITSSALVLKAKVPGISKEKFDECVKDAELNCPISKLLNTKITVEATLEA
jgi:osmotically inducible protein OsmC